MRICGSLPRTTMHERADKSPYRIDSDKLASPSAGPLHRMVALDQAISLHSPRHRPTSDRCDKSHCRPTSPSSAARGPILSVDTSERVMTRVENGSTVVRRPVNALFVLHWVLRIAVAAEYIGHGAFGILGKDAWLAYYAVFGIDEPI